MKSPRFCSITAQIAEHIRSEILRGRWDDFVPGRQPLAEELGVSPKTIRMALDQLEREGLLQSCGTGKRRRILTHCVTPNKSLRIHILPYETSEIRNRNMADLQHGLRNAGHSVDFAERSLCDLDMEVPRVAAMVSKTPADLWIVIAGSRPILEWFASMPLPTFALMGRMRGLPIAGTKPDKIQAQRDAIQRLHQLGHRRIVQIVRKDRVTPRPGALEQAFLDELESLGIPTGPYNLPVWHGGAHGFHRCLDSLFHHTPPTAVIAQEAPILIALQQYLARRGIFAPEKISLISGDPDLAFEWCLPAVSHISWSFQPILKRISRWVENVAAGRADLGQKLTKAAFIEGGTIGPVPVRSK